MKCYALFVYNHPCQEFVIIHYKTKNCPAGKPESDMPHVYTCVCSNLSLDKSTCLGIVHLFLCRC